MKIALIKTKIIHIKENSKGLRTELHLFKIFHSFNGSLEDREDSQLNLGSVVLFGDSWIVLTTSNIKQHVAVAL